MTSVGRDAQEEWDDVDAMPLNATERAHNLMVVADKCVQLRKEAAAIDALQQARDLYVLASGDDSEDAMYCTRELAIVLQNVGRVADALPLFEGLLVSRERVSGENSKATYGVICAIGRLYYKRKQPTLAARMFTRAQAIIEQVYPPGDVNVGQNSVWLARCLLAQFSKRPPKQAELAQCAAWLRSAIDIATQNPDSKLSKTLPKMYSLQAEVAELMGSLHDAKAALDAAVAFLEDTLSAEDPRLLSLCNKRRILQGRIQQREDAAQPPQPQPFQRLQRTPNSGSSLSSAYSSSNEGGWSEEERELSNGGLVFHRRSSDGEADWETSLSRRPSHSDEDDDSESDGGRRQSGKKQRASAMLARAQTRVSLPGKKPSSTSGSPHADSPLRWSMCSDPRWSPEPSTVSPAHSTFSLPDAASSPGSSGGTSAISRADDEQRKLSSRLGSLGKKLFRRRPKEDHEEGSVRSTISDTTSLDDDRSSSPLSSHGPEPELQVVMRGIAGLGSERHLSERQSTLLRLKEENIELQARLEVCEGQLGELRQHAVTSRVQKRLLQESEDKNQLLSATVASLQARVDKLEARPGALQHCGSETLEQLVRLHQEAMTATHSALLQQQAQVMRTKLMAEHRDGASCKICFDKRVEVCLKPCGHACLCRACGEKLQDCPLCRQPIRERVQVYLE